MKTWKIITIVGIILITIGSLTTSALAYMFGRGGYTPYGTSSTVNNPYGIFGGIMGGMMGGYNYATTPYTGQYSMGCRGWNGYVGTPSTTTGTLLNITTAVNIAQNYVVSTGNTNLKVDEVEEYTSNFYVLVKEKDTGFGAFELLINKVTGSVNPEMGPNMMWNTKYGGMSNSITGRIGGMIRGLFTGTTTGSMTVTIAQAKTNAQQFLDNNYPGTTVGDVDTFYGYYHIDVLQASNTYGMLSVNGYTGQIWYHNWHGNFIQAVEL
ncbi:MAG: hypothetical protein ACM3WQ_06225 [Chloroflexota bacterium]